MICENCGIEMEMFDRNCSNCGSEVEYASRKMEPRIPYSSPTETPVEEKILTSFETNKNKARIRVRFLWLVLLLAVVIVSGFKLLNLKK